MKIFMKMERSSVEGVTLRYFHQKANLMLGVDGQVLMKLTRNAIKTITRYPDGIRIRNTMCKLWWAFRTTIFVGEAFTDKNTRHCVNSLSIRFIPKAKELPKIINEE